MEISKDLPLLKELARTIRMLSADAVEKAASGHPGMPMGAADYATVLWAKYLRFNPKDPSWIFRDRFVLSAGHGSMLLYSLLHLFGYDLPLGELQNFRQWGSKTPGHPEFGHTVGVETTTGPLGQGFANGVGLALSGKMLGKRYGSELFEHRVFGIVSDGDLMEGVAAEAGSLAGHLGLNNLIYLYDDNEISIGGSTDVCFTESVAERFNSYGWYVQEIDGHDMEAAAKALDNAVTEKKRPSMIVCRTTIGLGAPKKAGTASAHGEPLGKDELKATKENLGWPLEPTFLIPQEVRAFCDSCVKEKAETYERWTKANKEWLAAFPAEAAQWKEQSSRAIPAALKDELFAAFKEAKKDSTRNLSGQALQVLAKHLPGLVGGSADLEPSTKTLIKGSPDVGPTDYSGRNLRFGVREHAMGSMVNGFAYSQCWFPYTATFLVFSDYMRPPIRLAALSHLQSLFIFTHESFWVGEDGPTHQPIEHIAALRLIPNLYVFRPADGKETAAAYLKALDLKKSPSALLFTRQNLPPLEATVEFSVDDAMKGAYALHSPKGAKAVLIATGSEVWITLAAAKELEAAGTPVSVVSMPCLDLFVEQDPAFKERILPKGLPRVSVEAGVTWGWERIVGEGGLSIGIDHFGASAPGEVLAEKFGFTSANVKARVLEWMKSK